MRLFSVVLCLAVTLSTAAVASDWLNPDVAYSGTRTLRIGDQEITGQIHYDHGNERFEWALLGARQISLRRVDKGLFYMIDPQMDVGMEMELTRSNAIPGAELFADLRPEELGQESLYGENVTKYRLIDDSGRETNTVLAWVTEDGIALRLQVIGPKGHFETTLTNLERGPQPAELFELPEGIQVIPAPKR